MGNTVQLSVRVLARPLLLLDLFQGTQLSAKKELPRVCQNAQWEVLLYTPRAPASVL